MTDHPPGAASTLRRDRTVAVALLVVAQAIVTLVAVRQWRFNADDLWNQVVWGGWRPFSSEVALPRDTYALHALVSRPVEVLLGRGVPAITIAAALLNIVAVVLVARFTWFLATRLGLTGRPALAAMVVVTGWYVLIGNDFAELSSRVNHRNIEFGLMLAAIQQLAVVGERRGAPRMAILTAGGLAVVYFNDPLLVVAVGLPLLLVIGVRWFIGAAGAGEPRIAVAVVGGLVGWAVLGVVLELTGVQVSEYAPPVFLQFGEAPRAAMNGVDYVLRLFGADVSGRDLRDVETFVHLMRLAVVGVVIIGAWHVRHRIPDRARSTVGMLVAAATATFTALVFAAIGSTTAEANPRYAAPIAVVVLVIAMLPIALGDRRVRLVVLAAVLAHGGVTALQTASDLPEAIDHDPAVPGRPSAQSLERELRARGASVAVADFWIAVPLDYWTSSEIEVSTLTCANGRPEPGGFARVDVLDELPEEVTVVVDDREFFGQCRQEHLDPHFGEPIASERLVNELGEGYVLLTYPGEVVERTLAERP